MPQLGTCVGSTLTEDAQQSGWSGEHADTATKASVQGVRIDLLWVWDDRADLHSPQAAHRHSKA